MKFIDEAHIEVRSGNGGSGCVHFMRQKYKPRMGPDGGNGGKGGNIYVVATNNNQSLLDYKYQKKYAAQNGEAGSDNGKDGKAGEDLIIYVPVGTLIINLENGMTMADLTTPEEKVLLSKGGLGGKGNKFFATSTRQAPKFAQPGEEGVKLKLKLELKLLADVALVGFPNAGKSTLVSVMSNARPKIADYPFTTLTPNLGVVRGYNMDFVIADIPGLIEGAHEGKGLGHRFLKHCERSRLLLYLLDSSNLSSKAYLDELKTLEHEVRSFSKELAALPAVIAISKSELLDNKSNELKDFEAFQESGIEFLKISSLNQTGLKELTHQLEAMLEKNPKIYKASDAVKLGRMDFFEET